MAEQPSAEDLLWVVAGCFDGLDGELRCQHVTADGRVVGWHRRDGPHACDWGNHDGQCPWQSRRSYVESMSTFS